MPVPPKEEQKRIYECLNNASHKFDKAIEKLTDEISVLEECKSKLIADTVTGKIDVRNIEIPEYEFVDEVVDADAEDDGEEATGEQED